MRVTNHLKILVVEDSPQDAFLFKTALGRAHAHASLHIVEDGVEAVRYLRHEGKYHERRTHPFPNFIISDVKMPQMDGFQFLRWVRSHPEASQVPIVLFSAAGNEADADQAYRLGANAYLVKPFSLEELTDLLRVTCDFWSRCIRPVAGQHHFTAPAFSTTHAAARAREHCGSPGA
jgi:two-component system, chemotaxis family, response regulator Rcp1